MSGLPVVMSDTAGIREAAGRVEQEIIAQPSDILPTVLSVIGLPAHEDLQGRDLMALLEGEAPASPLQAKELAFAELDRNVDWPRRWGTRFWCATVAHERRSWADSDAFGSGVVSAGDCGNHGHSSGCPPGWKRSRPLPWCSWASDGAG